MTAEQRDEFKSKMFGMFRVLEEELYELETQSFKLWVG